MVIGKLWQMGARPGSLEIMFLTYFGSALFFAFSNLNENLVCCLTECVGMFQMSLLNKLCIWYGCLFGEKERMPCCILALFKVSDFENPIIGIILISIGVPLLGVAASSLWDKLVQCNLFIFVWWPWVEQSSWEHICGMSKSPVQCVRYIIKN